MSKIIFCSLFFLYKLYLNYLIITLKVGVPPHTMPVKQDYFTESNSTMVLDFKQVADIIMVKISQIKLTIRSSSSMDTTTLQHQAVLVNPVVSSKNDNQGENVSKLLNTRARVKRIW